MSSNDNPVKVKAYGPEDGIGGGELHYKIPKGEVELRTGSGDDGYYHSVTKTVGRTIRSVEVETAVYDGRIDISSGDRDAKGVLHNTHHIEIQSKPVAHALADAMERAFDKGAVAPDDIIKFEKLREVIATAGAHDGKFDPEAIKAIVKRASEIAPDNKGAKRT
jgi:hypothetical protein